MKNLTRQNPGQLFVAQELINKVKSKCCGIKDNITDLQYDDKDLGPDPTGEAGTLTATVKVLPWTLVNGTVEWN